MRPFAGSESKRIFCRSVLAISPEFARERCRRECDAISRTNADRQTDYLT